MVYNGLHLQWVWLIVNNATKAMSISRASRQPIKPFRITSRKHDR